MSLQTCLHVQTGTLAFWPKQIPEANRNFNKNLRKIEKSGTMGDLERNMILPKLFNLESI